MTRVYHPVLSGRVLGWVRELHLPEARYHIGLEDCEKKIAVHRACGARLFRASFIPVIPPPEDRRCKQCMKTYAYRAWRDR